MISAKSDADAGCVFGYETVTEERSVFSQFLWSFQDGNPTLLSPVTLVMPPGWRAERVKIKLPAGFEVDELPDAAELNQSFGNYAVTYEVKDGHLIFKRTLVLKAAMISVEQYAAVRSFFERIRAAEQAPVVLAKK